MAGDVKHDYHLVNPSPWPILAALAVIFVTFGAVFAMKPDAISIGALIRNWKMKRKAMNRPHLSFPKDSRR